MPSRRIGTILITRTVTVRSTVQRRVQISSHVSQRRSISTTARSLPAAAPPPHVFLADEGYGPFEDPYREYDLFVSHASEDKDFVGPIVEALRARGVKVWYDETEIRLGDSLREKIDAGLARCRFGVVTLSKAFFSKRWTNYELNGLVSREIQGRKVILPVWHPDMTMSELLGFSPPLADKKALAAAGLSADEIAGELAALIFDQH